VTEEVEKALDCLCDAEALRSRSLRAVWLFGSHARGQPRPASDLDLATASSTLAWEILTTGLLMIENDELANEAFLRRTRYAAEDEARRNRMIVLAQAPRVGTKGS